jgi:hypothetical protein
VIVIVIGIGIVVDVDAGVGFAGIGFELGDYMDVTGPGWVEPGEKKVESDW